MKVLEKYIEKYNILGIFDETIIPQLRLVSYGKGEIICRSGMDVEYLQFLVKGRIKVIAALSNGKSLLLRVQEPLSIFGDLEMFDYSNYTANVEALVDCLCIVVPMGFVRKKYSDHPPLLKFIIRRLGMKLHSISYISAENLYLPLKNRFSAYLLIHGERREKVIHLKSSFTDVSDLLGVSYRQLSRTMKQMEEDGLFHKEGHVFQITDYDQLLSLAENSFLSMGKN